MKFDSKITYSEEVVNAIVNDITSRRGLRQAWEEIDDDVQEEIIKKWCSIIDDLINEVI